jgi:hypothetical protein
MSALSRPEKFQRVIEMMSREYMHNDLVIHHTDSPRLLPTFVDELTNHYGLYVEREFRFFLNEETGVGKWNKVYYLPVQAKAGTFAHAATLLPEFYAPAAAALRELERAHPRAAGSHPELPGLEEDPRPPNEAELRNLDEAALHMMSEKDRWLTVSEFHDLKETPRLSANVRRLRLRGINVITEMRPNPHGGRPFAAYHVFTDPVEEAAYMAEREEKERIQAKHQQEAEERAAAKKQETADAKLAREAAKIAEQAAKASRKGHRAPPAQVAPGQSKYGGWKGATPIAPPQPGAGPRRLFQAPTAKPVVTAPPTALRERILQMPAAAAAKEPVPKGSAPGVPAAELDTLHPRADRNTVVEFEGVTYQKAFRPLVKSPDGTRVLKWDPYWFIVSCKPQAA